MATLPQRKRACVAEQAPICDRTAQGCSAVALALYRSGRRSRKGRQIGPHTGTPRPVSDHRSTSAPAPPPLRLRRETRHALGPNRPPPTPQLPSSTERALPFPSPPRSDSEGRGNKTPVKPFDPKEGALCLIARCCRRCVSSRKVRRASVGRFATVIIRDSLGSIDVSEYLFFQWRTNLHFVKPPLLCVSIFSCLI